MELLNFLLSYKVNNTYNKYLYYPYNMDIPYYSLVPRLNSGYSFYVNKYNYKEAKVNLTDEQRVIIEETITNPPGVYGTLARAGVGKSFTIFKAMDYIKEHQPKAKILYLVFNKANQIEAEQKLQKYALTLVPIEVATAHSFALQCYRLVNPGIKVISRLDRDLIYEFQKKSYKRDIKYSKHAPFHWLHDKFGASKLILKTFCEELLEHFQNYYDGPDKAKDCELLTKSGRKIEAFGIPVDAYSCVTQEHVYAFEEIMNIHIKKRMYTHAMYLKTAAYAKYAKLKDYDYVFFDEAQDASYFMLKLLDKHSIGKLYFIGDDRQSIYNFGGATENVFETMHFDKLYTLSKSFRFGKNIADLANAIITMHSKQKLVGTEQSKEYDKTKLTRLYRTNAKLFKDALDLAYQAVQNGIKLKIDFMKPLTEDASLHEIMAFLKLFYQYEKRGIYLDNKQFLDAFETPESLRQFEQRLEETNKFYNTYNEFYDFLPEDIHVMLNYAKAKSTFLDKYKALLVCLKESCPIYKITMITMHRSKGLQWPNVMIAEPTKLYYEDKNGVIRRNSNFMQELNLAYVAVTRAEKHLDASVLRNELCNESDKFEDISLIVGE